MVELEWAIELNKKTILYYQFCENEYTFPSWLWVAIQDIMQRSKDLKVIPFKEYGEKMIKIKKRHN